MLLPLAPLLPRSLPKLYRELLDLLLLYVQ